MRETSKQSERKESNVTAGKVKISAATDFN